MIVLGVETSGPVGSIALRRDGRCVEERFLPELGRRHAQSLVPEVVRFLRGRDVAPGSIDVVAVSVGPGSFTGLRVGVTFAKMFAYASGARLVAVETFLAIAEDTSGEPSVAVVADAQRGGLILGRYERSAEGLFVRQGDLRLVGIDELAVATLSGDLLTGPGVERLSDAWSGRIAPTRARLPRAAVIASLGERQARLGEFADPRSLEPLYVRKSGAEEKADAAARVGGT